MTLTPKEEMLARKYRRYITNTGGNDPVELCNRTVDSRINLPVAMLQSMVLAQVQLLAGLDREGLLR